MGNRAPEQFPRLCLLLHALNIQCGKPWRLGCEDAWDREPGRARGLVGEGTQSSGWGEGGRFQTCHPCLGTAKGTVEVTLGPVPASSIAGCPLVRVPLSETNPTLPIAHLPWKAFLSARPGATALCRMTCHRAARPPSGTTSVKSSRLQPC